MTARCVTSLLQLADVIDEQYTKGPQVAVGETHQSDEKNRKHIVHEDIPLY